MKKSDELKQQVKPNQINYTLIALDLLAGVAKDSNYIRHRDIVEVGEKIRGMISSENFFNESLFSIYDIIEDYGKLMKSYGVCPAFYMDEECYEIFANVDAKELNGDNYIKFSDLSEQEQSIPGVVGKYCGVLIVRNNKL